MSEKYEQKNVQVQPQQRPRLEAPPLAPLPSAGSVQMVQAVQVEPVASSTPKPSPVWRIVGYIKRKDPDAAEDPGAWPSQTGYNLPPPEQVTDATKWQQDQAILHSLAGMRTVSLTACQQFENSVEYYCDIDGERITPWTGQQALSQQIGNLPMQSARTAIAPQQSEGATAARVDQAQKPAPETSL